jgi:hypothetical protein
MLVRWAVYRRGLNAIRLRNHPDKSYAALLKLPKLMCPTGMIAHRATFQLRAFDPDEFHDKRRDLNNRQVTISTC